MKPWAAEEFYENERGGVGKPLEGTRMIKVRWGHSPAACGGWLGEGFL